MNSARENTVLHNRFESNVVGVFIDHGVGNTIEGGNVFNANDVAVEVVNNGMGNVISKNSIFQNLAGIRLEEGSHLDIKPPVLSSVQHDGSMLSAELAITADELELGKDYVVELFRSRRLDPKNVGNVRDLSCDQGKTFIGSRTFSLTSTGTHNLAASFALDDLQGQDNFSATVTVTARGTSEFSNCLAFVPPDTDGDGRSDMEEDRNGGDANGDGIPDSQQSEVARVSAVGPGGDEIGSVVLSAKEKTPGKKSSFISTFNIPIGETGAPFPEGVQAPLGAFGFEIDVKDPGLSAEVRIKIPGNVETNCLLKLARRTPEGEEEWFCLENLVEFDFSTHEWVFTLTDGALGDIDFVTDAIIRDPIVPAFDPDRPRIVPPAGLPDEFEQEFFGSATGADPDTDSDGDGASEFAEFVAGTDPKQATDRLFAKITREEATVVVTFDSKIGREYAVQTSTDLTKFIDQGQMLTGTGNELRAEFPESDTLRYFRIRVEIP